MRFDQAVWQGMPVPERIGYTMECILDQARRFSLTLRERFDRTYDEAERHYGGSAH